MIQVELDISNYSMCGNPWGHFPFGLFFFLAPPRSLPESVRPAVEMTIFFLCRFNNYIRCRISQRRQPVSSYRHPLCKIQTRPTFANLHGTTKCMVQPGTCGSIRCAQEISIENGGCVRTLPVTSNCPYLASQLYTDGCILLIRLNELQVYTFVLSYSILSYAQKLCNYKPYIQ